MRFLGILFRPVRAWWRWAGRRQTTQGKVLAYAGPVAALIVTIVIASVAGGCGEGDGEQAVGQPTEVADEVTEPPAAEEEEEPTEAPEPTQPPEPTDTPEPSDEGSEATQTVAASLGPNELGIAEDDLLSIDNPIGDGTFVYVEQTRFFGVERFIIWLVLDGTAYPLNGATKNVIPALPFPLDADQTVWARTGLSPYQATEALEIVFGEN